MRTALYEFILALALCLPALVGKFRTMGPQCICTTGCVIFTDDYATDKTGTSYSVSSGTWTVGGGAIATGSTGAFIVATTAGAAGHGRVIVSGKTSTSGGSFALVGSYVDANNYLFAEVVINGASSTFKLWKRVSGTSTQLGSTYTFTGSTGTYYKIEICWNGSAARAMLGDNLSFISAAYTGTGNKISLAASPNGGTSTFDDLTFFKNYVDDATCNPCGGSTVTCVQHLENCLSGIVPVEISTTVTFNVNAAQPCDTECSTIQGTYILSMDSPLGARAFFLNHLFNPYSFGCANINMADQCYYEWGYGATYSVPACSDNASANIGSFTVQLSLVKLLSDNTYRLIGLVQVFNASNIAVAYIQARSASLGTTVPNCMTALNGTVINVSDCVSPTTIFGSVAICGFSSLSMTFNVLS